MNKPFSQKNIGQKGAVAVLLTLLVVIVIFLIAFSLSSIFVIELKISNLSSQSAKAYYAAESGIEYALKQLEIDGNSSGQKPIGCDPDEQNISLWQVLTNEARYCVSWDSAGASSSGAYGTTRRRISAGF